MRSQSKLLPLNLISKCIKSLWELMPELENLNCNWKIAGGSLYTSMEGKNSGGTQFIRVYPTLWWVLPPCDLSALDMNERKLIHTVFKVRGKCSILEYSHRFPSFEVLPTAKLFNRCQTAKNIRLYLTWKEVNIDLQVTLPFHGIPGVEKSRNTQKNGIRKISQLNPLAILLHLLKVRNWKSLVHKTEAQVHWNTSDNLRSQKYLPTLSSHKSPIYSTFHLYSVSYLTAKTLEWFLDHGGIHLQSQHSGDRSRWISVNLRPILSTKWVTEKSGLLHEETLLKHIK